MPSADNSRPDAANPYTPDTNAVSGAREEPLSNRSAGSLVGRLGETGKITAVIAIMAIAFWFVSKKLKGVTWADVQRGFDNLPLSHILFALLLTALNYLILTGYDWIAIRHLKKKLPFSRMISGAIVGYSAGNVLGWLFGGNIVRYRMYSKWGFSALEIIALVSILSITFWLGLFLLAGVAFLVLPVHLPDDVLQMLTFESKLWGHISLSQTLLGGIFLGSVGAYLLACILIRRPIRFRDFSVSLPPFRLSAMQLMVSAGDFLLATATLYALMPPDIVGPDKVNFSTVLIAYLTAQIVAVLTHVPGGYGLLEFILLTFLGDPESGNEGPILCAVILFRLIYYLLPFLVAIVLFVVKEYLPSLSKSESSDGG
ncbi:MAG: lysylphosphatidylglycerol synthase domain-containing protein [Planctomycetota bacterium]